MRRRGGDAWRGVVAAAVAAALFAPALGAAPITATGQGSRVVWDLFVESLDAFTAVLLAGSLLASGVIARCVIDVRTSQILPASSVDRIDELIEAGREGELRELVKTDESFAARVVAAALRELGRGRDAMLDAAEATASTETARWFRKIELLNVIGNLGPLVGLAGTVWGMIVAFTSLEVTGGTSAATQLAPGISKALFHTLLGLLLAIPCLFVFGVYRSAVDRICTRGIAESGRLVEKLARTSGGG